ncbi:MAG: DUF4013 domain-containing protein [Anaerolineae bacterium]|nr:DUF4013 domain-containing protein [Anaerolineae bacterium]
MDVVRAFMYTFDDQEWTPKLLISAGIAFASIITMPLLIGFVGIAALLGYQVELIRNLREGHPTPLPRWDRYSDKIQRGANVLAAVVVYNLPNFIPVCCLATTSGLWGDGFIGSTVGIFFTCCLLPLILIYNLITWPMLALGMGRYAVENNVGVFFQFGDLFSTLYRRLNVTLPWAVYTLIANIVLGFIGAIPCLGWAVAPALGIAIHGYLTAGLVSEIEDGISPKRKR